MSEAVREAALLAHRAGLCVFPPKEDGSKRPDTDEEWKTRQTRRTTDAELLDFYANGRTGLGVITGAVSGGLELLDFDEHEVFAAFRERAAGCGLGELVRRISDGYLEETPNGVHLPYRCPEISGNTKLARREKRPDERRHPGDRIQVRIETRAEGGFAIIAPSHGRVHESGRSYCLVQGGPESIVTITPAEREALHELARSFDEMPRQTKREPSDADDASRNMRSSSGGSDELRPGADFNARATWREILEPRGWRFVFERGDESYWRRPGKSEGISATTNYRGSDLLYVFSTSTEFEAERGYDKFGALTLLEHGGSLDEAARALRAHGYGSAEPRPARAPSDPPEEDVEPERSRAVDLERIAFSGARLLALLDRPAPEPVVAGIPTAGHLTLEIAPAFSGKTSLALWRAMARAAGVAPWPGAPEQPAGRVLLFSIDEAPEQVARRMRSLSLFHPAGELERFVENLSVIGPDREIDPDALDPLRFDARGLAILAAWIERSVSEGRPFVEIYIDAYADMIPLGETENSNELGTMIGGALERLAVRHGPAIVLLHHTGKPKADAGEDPPDLRYLSRGASSLAAKARVVMSLERIAAMPHLRRIRTITNLSRTPKPLVLAVCGTDSDQEEILYFRPHDPTAAYAPGDYLTSDPISTTAFAWKLSGAEPEKGKRPPGEFNRLAAELRDQWLRAGLIEVSDGPHAAKMIALAKPENSRETR